MTICGILHYFWAVKIIGPMILHITSKRRWETALVSGTYTDTSFESEGFIHCSTREQLLGSANDYFRGQPDLLLLCISSSEVEAPIVYEDCYEKGIAYPHIYGTLNVNAVMHVIDFLPNADGSFSLPSELSSSLNDC